MVTDEQIFDFLMECPSAGEEETCVTCGDEADTSWDGNFW